MNKDSQVFSTDSCDFLLHNSNRTVSFYKTNVAADADEWQFPLHSFSMNKQ